MILHHNWAYTPYEFSFVIASFVVLSSSGLPHDILFNFHTHIDGDISCIWTGVQYSTSELYSALWRWLASRRLPNYS